MVDKGILTPEQVAQLASKTRAPTTNRAPKGTYVERLIEFVNSDEFGVCVQDVWPELARGKSAAAVALSFKQNLRKAGAGLEDLFTVLERDGKVFLLHNERLAQHNATEI